MRFARPAVLLGLCATLAIVFQSGCSHGQVYFRPATYNTGLTAIQGERIWYTLAHTNHDLTAVATLSVEGRLAKRNKSQNKNRDPKKLAPASQPDRIIATITVRNNLLDQPVTVSMTKSVLIDDYAVPLDPPPPSGSPAQTDLTVPPGHRGSTQWVFPCPPGHDLGAIAAISIDWSAAVGDAADAFESTFVESLNPYIPESSVFFGGSSSDDSSGDSSSIDSGRGHGRDHDHGGGDHGHDHGGHDHGSGDHDGDHGGHDHGSGDHDGDHGGHDHH